MNKGRPPHLPVRVRGPVPRGGRAVRNQVQLIVYADRFGGSLPRTATTIREVFGDAVGGVRAEAKAKGGGAGVGLAPESGGGRGSVCGRG